MDSEWDDDDNDEASGEIDGGPGENEFGEFMANHRNINYKSDNLLKKKEDGILIVF